MELDREGPGEEAPAARPATIVLHHGGRERTSRLLEPLTAPPGPAALVLLLHGRGGGGPWFDRLTAFPELAGREGFVLALPEAADGRWNDGRDTPAAGHGEPDDVGFLVRVIQDVAGRRPIDPDRVFVVGMSNGATMAGRLVCERADLIAALVQVAGTAAPGVAGACHPDRAVPTLLIHGTSDWFAPYDGGRRYGLMARAMLLGRGGGGPVVAVDAWARARVAANGAHETPRIERLPPDVEIRRWHGPTPASDVVCYRIEGGGHTWPGGVPALPRPPFGRTSKTINASEVAWSFFADHSPGTGTGDRGAG